MNKSWTIGIAVASIIGLGALAYSYGMGGYGITGSRGSWGNMGPMMGMGHGGHCAMTQHTGGYYGAYTNQTITKDVAQNIARDYLTSIGNPNFKQGKIKETEHEFQVEIVTKDNSLVEKLFVDKHTGSVRSTY